MGLMEIVLAAVVGLLVIEASDWLPSFSTFVIRTAAQRLRADRRSRYLEEWLAEAEHIPGKLSRLSWALSLILASYRMAAENPEQTKRLVATGFAEKDAFGDAALASDSNETEVTCSHCGAALDEHASIPPSDRQPCPRCGSMSRSISVSISEGVVAVAGASFEAVTTKYR